MNPATTPQVASLSILDLLAASGWMAKLVLLSLLGSSVVCWAVILSKWRSLKKATFENNAFLGFFWNGQSLDEVLSHVHQFPSSPIAQVFKSGTTELRRMTGPDQRSRIDSIVIENISRAISRASNLEVARMERQVSWLATTASAAPFVGLFGTVWGIMTSFQSIGASGQANLAVVAPGISEALITTAAGIAAAIPAVIAYNHFAGSIRRIVIDIDSFSQDFLNLVQSNATNQASPDAPQPPRRGI